MTRRPTRWSLLSVGAAAILAITACSGGAATPVPATPAPVTPAPATPAPVTPAPATPAPVTPAPETATPAAATPAAATPTAAPSETTALGTPAATPAGTPYPTPLAQPPAPAAGVTAYPDPSYGTVDCKAGTFNGLPYSGNLKLMKATDPNTVEFDFCNPDVAFLSQIAFGALGIDDAQYLIDHMADGSILNQPNGTGPYQLTTWDKGNRMDFTAFANYWGTKALTPNLEIQWNDQSAARLLALTSGTAQGINNPDKNDLPAIQANTSLKFYPRTGLNTFYLGFNNTVKPFDQLDVRKAVAMAVDRKRLVDNFYPPGSSVADYFTPCEIPDACSGGKWPYAYDPAGAKTLLQQGLAKDNMTLADFAPKLQFRPSVRDYLPDPPTIAQEIQSELQTNLGITVTLDQQESGTFLANNAAGKLDGIFMLGWLADFPDTSDFLDYHFGPGAGVKFGTPFPDLVKAIQSGDQTANDTQRAADYGKANDLINQDVPAVVMVHGGGGAVFDANVTGAHTSPLNNEVFAAMKAPTDTLTFVQSSEPLSMYCGDETDGETFRVCNQEKESLYSYKVAGLDPIPALATGCTANTDLTVWTCKLRTGVTFHNGATFGADDVILSFAAQWDALNPLHKGHTGDFEYWLSLIGQGFLNPPAPCGLANSPACP